MREAVVMRMSSGRIARTTDAPGESGAGMAAVPIFAISFAGFASEVHGGMADNLVHRTAT